MIARGWSLAASLLDGAVETAAGVVGIALVLGLATTLAIPRRRQ